jgi:uncharacterized membrane protein
MEIVNLGRILALLGLILVLLTGWVRRQARAQKQSPSPALLKLQSWGGLVALGLILAGLILMNYQNK